MRYALFNDVLRVSLGFIPDGLSGTPLSGLNATSAPGPAAIGDLVPGMQPRGPR
jgi:hypothetical protein